MPQAGPGDHVREAFQASRLLPAAIREGLTAESVSVERVFGRIKTYGKLNAIRTRGMPKIWLHVALSVLVMNAAAVVNAAGDVRKCVA